MPKPRVLLYHSEADHLASPAVLGTEFSAFSAPKVVNASVPSSELSLLEIHRALGQVAPKVVVVDGSMDGKQGGVDWKELILYFALQGAPVIVAGEGNGGLDELVDAKREGAIADHVENGADSTSRLQEAVRKALNHRINMMFLPEHVTYPVRSEEFVFDPQRVSQLGAHWRNTIHNPEGVFDLRELLIQVSGTANLAQNLFDSGEVQTAVNVWARTLNMLEYAKQEEAGLNLVNYLLTNSSSVQLLGRDKKRALAIQAELKRNPNYLGSAADSLSFSQLETLMRMSKALESAASAYSSSAGIIRKEDRDEVLNGIYTQLESLWGSMRTVLGSSSSDTYWRAEFTGRIGLTEATQRRMFEEDDDKLTRLTALEAEMLTPADRVRLLKERVFAYIGRAERTERGANPGAAHHLDPASAVAHLLHGMIPDLDASATGAVFSGIGAYQLARVVYDHGHQDRTLSDCEQAFVTAGERALAVGSPVEIGRYLAAQQNLVTYIALTTPSRETRADQVLDRLRATQEHADKSPLGQRANELYRRACFAFDRER